MPNTFLPYILISICLCSQVRPARPWLHKLLSLFMKVYYLSQGHETDQTRSSKVHLDLLLQTTILVMLLTFKLQTLMILLKSTILLMMVPSLQLQLGCKFCTKSNLMNQKSPVANATTSFTLFMKIHTAHLGEPWLQLRL